MVGSCFIGYMNTCADACRENTRIN